MWIIKLTKPSIPYSSKPFIASGYPTLPTISAIRRHWLGYAWLLFRLAAANPRALALVGVGTSEGNKTDINWPLPNIFDPHFRNRFPVAFNDHQWFRLRTWPLHISRLIINFPPQKMHCLMVHFGKITYSEDGHSRIKQLSLFFLIYFHICPLCFHHLLPANHYFSSISVVIFNPSILHKTASQKTGDGLGELNNDDPN